MCIVGGEVQVAEQDIPVWKVFVKNREVCYFTEHTFVSNIEVTCDGVSLGATRSLTTINYTTPSNSLAWMDIVNTIDEDQFNAGFGYSCFPTNLHAEAYELELINNCLYQKYHLQGGNKELVIIPMIIPKGSQYSKGRIMPGLYGEGLSAIRTECLKEVPE